MKKLYKNIIIVLMALMAVFAVLAIWLPYSVSYAEEATGTEIVEEVTTTEEVSEEENYTLLGRLWEWLSDNYAEVISTAGTVLAGAVAIIVPLFNKKSKSSITTTELNLLSKQSDTVDAVNTLIESYNTLTEKYAEVEQELAEYNSEENAKYTAIGSMVTQTKAILEILTTVYANSKNLPQGVKDIINLKYATALKTTSNEEALAEVVQEAEAEAAEG